jgi:hypothetical protein
LGSLLTAISLTACILNPKNRGSKRENERQKRVDGPAVVRTGFPCDGGSAPRAAIFRPAPFPHLTTTYILSFKPIAQLQFDNNADEQRQMSYLVEFVIDQDGFWRIKDM